MSHCLQLCEFYPKPYSQECTLTRGSTPTMVDGLAAGLDGNYPKEEPDEPEPLIKSMYWECEAWRVDKWRPFTALLDYNLFSGPNVRHAKGIDLNKNLVAYAHGPRGGTKTLSMSYWLAKEMRIEKPTWTNYPISFYVQEKDEFTGKESDQYQHISPCHWINTDNTLSYYESMPLDMDKFYTFDRLIRNGAVGIDELQYLILKVKPSAPEFTRMKAWPVTTWMKTGTSITVAKQMKRPAAAIRAPTRRPRPGHHRILPVLKNRHCSKPAGACPKAAYYLHFGMN